MVKSLGKISSCYGRKRALRFLAVSFLKWEELLKFQTLHFNYNTACILSIYFSFIFPFLLYHLPPPLLASNRFFSFSFFFSCLLSPYLSFLRNSPIFYNLFTFVPSDFALNFQFTRRSIRFPRCFSFNVAIFRSPLSTKIFRFPNFSFSFSIFYPSPFCKRNRKIKVLFKFYFIQLDLSCNETHYTKCKVIISLYRNPWCEYLFLEIL